MTLYPVCLENLPMEIVVKILDSLDFKDLMNVLLVSRSFYSLATDPLLWKTFELPHRIESEVLVNTLKLDRFKKLEAVHLYQGCQCQSPDKKMTNSQIVSIFEGLENVELKHLTIQHFDLTSLDPCFLSRVVNNIANVYFNHCVVISDAQIKNIMEDTCKLKKLKNLQVDKLDLSNVEVKSLSKAINALQTFFSVGCNFSIEQLKSIFDTMATKTNLKEFTFIQRNGINEITPLILARAFNNLESIYIAHCRLSADQLLCFLQQLSKHSRMKKLNFVFKDSYQPLLGPVPADILSQGLNNLEFVSIPFLALSDTQMQCVLQGVAKITSKVKVLDLGENTVPELSLEMLRNIVKKLQPNTFKVRLQEKILEIYENTIKSLRQELVEKEARQVELREKCVKLRTEQKKLKLKEKFVRSKLMTLLAKSRQQKSVGASSRLSKEKRNLLRQLSDTVQVQVIRKSKLSSSFRFATKSRIAKKSDIVLKIKLV